METNKAKELLETIFDVVGDTLIKVAQSKEDCITVEDIEIIVDALKKTYTKNIN